MTSGKSGRSRRQRPVPYGTVPPGFEAVYTGKKRPPGHETVELITTLAADEGEAEYRKWSVVPWTWPGREEEWDDQVRFINRMQQELGPLDEDVRRIRAHIASLVPCDSGLPVTVDEVLQAIGRGRLIEPSFRNGCWCPGMWWEQTSTQPGQMESMHVIAEVLRGYLDGRKGEAAARTHPKAASFVDRTYGWLGPIEALQGYQRLMLERALLTIDEFSKYSGTVPRRLFVDPNRESELEATVTDLFEEGGRGASLDARISKGAGLPTIHPRWKPEYRENMAALNEAAERELYDVCCAIASGVHTLSDCHHNTFRYIESWIHGIGNGRLEVPHRIHSAERERLGRLLFGYVLGLDRWLSEAPMQFVLMDLGHVDLGFDPKNEIVRVYAYLGAERSPVKQWLATCLWHNLSYSPIAGNPGGLVRHEDLLDRAARAGVSTRQWMESNGIARP